MGGNLEKPQLINFIAKVMEDSGFKVYKNFKTSQRVIDIYAILPTTIGDFGVVVACKNYDKTFEIGVDVLREMEQVQESIKASKVTVVASCYFSAQAKNYALRKNIKLVDRDNLVDMAKRYQDNMNQEAVASDTSYGGSYIEDEYPEYTYDASDMEYLMQRRDQNPHVYKNTLYRQVDEPRASPLSGILNRTQRSSNRSLSAYSSGGLVGGADTLFFRLISNPIALIVFVVIVAYIIAFIAGNILKMDAGFTGLIEMFVALLLSYGLSFYTERNSEFIIRGTFVFFISLIVLIILIFV